MRRLTSASAANARSAHAIGCLSAMSSGRNPSGAGVAGPAAGTLIKPSGTSSASGHAVIRGRWIRRQRTTVRFGPSIISKPWPGDASCISSGTTAPLGARSSTDTSCRPVSHAGTDQTTRARGSPFTSTALTSAFVRYRMKTRYSPRRGASRRGNHRRMRPSS